MTRFRLPLLLAIALPGIAPAATLLVGPGLTYARPCDALTKAQPFDTVEIDGTQTYRGDACRITASNLTIKGVRGRPKIDAGGKNADGKGTWVITGNDVTVDNVEMFGSAVSDRNGAAIRLEGNNFTLRNSFLHDNENGVLTGASPTSRLVMEFNEFGHNGSGDGYSHNVYVGQVASLVFRHNYSHDAHIGHNLKSRAQINMVAYNRFSSLNKGETGSTAAGKPSYEIDLSNAGNAYVIGNVIQQPAEHSNSNMLAYGLESPGKPGDKLYVVNNTFINDAHAGTFVLIGEKVTAAALLQNNFFSGKGTVTNQQRATQTANYQGTEADFVNRAAYDLHPNENRRVINAGAEPPKLESGISLAPTRQYKHVAGGEPRPVIGALDVGAYQTVIVQESKKPWYNILKN